MSKRFLLWLLLVVGVSPGPLSSAALAQNLTPGDEARLASAIDEARRQIDLAQLRLRVYERVEYPRRLRQLNAEIALVAAEVERNRVLLAEYQRISRNTIPDPLIVTRQATELALLAGELKLRDLREENHLLARGFDEECRFRQLEVESARAELRRLLAAQGAR